MSQFNPDKLLVEYLDGVTATEPVILRRRYTLTHSDETGDLFLTVGRRFAWHKIKPIRDEVLGQWKIISNSLYYFAYLHIDEGEFTQAQSKKRFEIFRRELPLALKAIRYGDRFLFDAHPYLNQTPIIVNFLSTYPQLAKQENWGTWEGY